MGLNDDFKKVYGGARGGGKPSYIPASMPRSLHEEWIKEILNDPDSLSSNEENFVDDIDRKFSEFPVMTLSRAQEEWLERIVERIRK